MPTPPRSAPRRCDRLAVLDQIATYQRAHRGRSPSQRLIGLALGLSAPSIAHAAIHALARNGLLVIHPTARGHPADLELTPAGHAALAEWRKQQLRPDAEHTRTRGGP